MANVRAYILAVCTGGDGMRRAILLISMLALLLQPVLAWQTPQYKGEEMLIFLAVVIAIGIGIGIIIARILLSITENEIQYVIDRHENELFRIEGVVAIEADRKRKCIKVYVKKGAETERIPRSLEGYPVEVERVGRVRLIFWRIIQWIWIRPWY
jgi:hypothetical protein